MLDVPALFNMLFGVVISFTTGPFPLMSLFTGLWIVCVCTPAAFVLPFELTGVRTRAVAVVSSLVGSFSGLGLAAGPIVTGLVAQFTASLQTGLVTLCLLTDLGVDASPFYPRYHRKAGPAMLRTHGD